MSRWRHSFYSKLVFEYSYHIPSFQSYICISPKAGFWYERQERRGVLFTLKDGVQFEKNILLLKGRILLFKGRFFVERQERRGVLFTLKHGECLKGGDVITVALHLFISSRECFDGLNPFDNDFRTIHEIGLFELSEFMNPKDKL